MFSNKFIVRFISVSTGKYKKTALNNVKGKSVSSQHWLTRQLSDPYVEKAKMFNYRCRSAFKLIEIDDKYKFLREGNVVIDCGAAPGSWTQVAVKKVNSNASDINKPKGFVISVDKSQFHQIEGAIVLGNCDFTIPETQEKIKILLPGEADVVLSDMAPSATGIREMDNENILNLCYSVVRFAVNTSKVDASLLIKLWQCGERPLLETNLLKFYKTVKLVKPNSSRSDSAEVFLLARGFKGILKDD